MKSEYLITFDSKDCICTDVDKFKSLLSAHGSISFERKEKIRFQGQEFSYKLAEGNLTDGSIYYDLTVERADSSDQELYKELLKDIRTICTKISGRQIIVLHDGIGEEYCKLGYPIIFKTENLMRKLISKFMAISIGYDWSDASTPKEVLDSVRTDGGRREKTNLLHEVDFIQLSNFLFKKYTKADANRFFDSLKEKEDSESISIGDLKQYVPFTNWEKYFSRNVNCDSEYIKSRWERLYEHRCKIAHCKSISKIEYDDLITISTDVCEKIQSALDSIGDFHVDEADREDLAENISGMASKNAADFIERYNKIAAMTRIACEIASGDDDVYRKHATNKTNIQMQSLYLLNAKGIIDSHTADSLLVLQNFRNILVHGIGRIEITDADMMSKIELADNIISIFSTIRAEDLNALKGVDLRNEK